MQTEHPARRGSLRDPARWLAVLLVALAAAAFVAACIHRYGDVDDDNVGHPEPLTVFVGVVVAAAACAGVGSFVMERGGRVFTGLGVAVLGAGAVSWVLVATGKQTFPRAGGMWLLFAAFDTVLIGLLVAVGMSDVRSADPRRLSVSAMGAVLVVTLALAASIAGPNWWVSHTADRTTTSVPAANGAYPTSFSAVAWRHPLVTGEEFAGTYGGRVMVAVTDLRRCRSGVRALDALTGKEVWHYLVPNRCSTSNRVSDLSLLGSDDLLQVAVGDTVGVFLDPKTGRVLDSGALHRALFFVSGNVGIAQDKSGSLLSGTADDAKITVFGYDLAHRTEVWRRPAPTCATGQLVAVLGPPGRTLADSWNVHPTPGSSNSVVDLPNNGFAMGYACRLSQKTFVQHVWIVRPGGRDQDLDLGTAQFVDIPPVPILLSTPQGLLVQTRAGVRNIGPEGTVKWISSHGKSDEIRHLFALDDGSVLLPPGPGGRNVVRLDAASGRELSSDDYLVLEASQVRGHLVYDTDRGGTVQDALHPVREPKVFAAGVAHGLLEDVVLPGVEVIGGQHEIVGIR